MEQDTKAIKRNEADFPNSRSATEDDGSKKRLLLPIKDKQNRLIQRVGERVAVDEEEEEEEIEEVEETEAPKGFEDDEGFESGTGW